MHREGPSGPAALRDPGRAPVGAVSGGPQAGLGAGGDGGLQDRDGGGPLQGGDPSVQPWDELRGEEHSGNKDPEF